MVQVCEYDGSGEVIGVSLQLTTDAMSELQNDPQLHGFATER